MIRGIGTDMIEVRRIEAAIEREAFVSRVFTEEEQNYCNSRGVQRAASYAARFAAKEAVMKALGTGLRGGSWLEIRVNINRLGGPEVKLVGYFRGLAKEVGVDHIHISLSHTKEYAIAYVILEGGEFLEASNSNSNAGD